MRVKPHLFDEQQGVGVGMQFCQGGDHVHNIEIPITNITAARQSTNVNSVVSLNAIHNAATNTKTAPTASIYPTYALLSSTRAAPAL